jgi:pSer/pThr/pTyr-binding forkhead associated (FHA) protein
LRSRIWLGLIAGTIGGLVGFILQELFIPYNSYMHMINGVCTAVPPQTVGPGIVLALCVFGLTGLCLGMVNGIVEGNQRKLVQGAILGFLGGVIIGRIGANLGGMFYDLLGGSNKVIQTVDIFSFLRQMLARCFQLGFIGLGIGTGASLATLSLKRIRNGAIGGLLGGFLGGVLFDLLAPITNPVHSVTSGAGCYDAGGPGRAVSFIAIGALTGFFIGLVEELLKQAWVKVLAGRNEGKDFILYKNMNILGRDERSDVPLFGDTGVAVQHAAIRADGRRHVLLAADTPTGTVVNGQPVAPNTELLLRDGDMIQIGSHRIMFHEKATASRLTRPNPDDVKSKKAAPGVVPMPSNFCPFCGSPKDASGGCLCTVAGGPAASGRSVSAMQGPMSQGEYAPLTGGDTVPFGQGTNASADPYGHHAAAMGGYGASSGSSAVGVQLFGVEGPYSGQVFPLTGANMIIGREAGRDIVLSADSTVSRNHASLVYEGAGIVVYDAGSSNGTYVNGMRVMSPVALVPGDIIQFGSSKFRYE